jgi:hypothetical protein
MKPQTLDDAVNDAVYASGITKPCHVENDLVKPDRRAPGGPPHVRFEPPPRVTREPPRSDRYQEGRKPASWGNRRDGRREERWDDHRDDRQEDRRTPPERPRREFRPPEARAGPPPREASRGLTNGQVEDARRQLERLSLNLRDRPRGNAYYYTDEDELAHMLDCKEIDDERDAYESYLHADEAYIKRMAEFEDTGLPRKRQAAEFGTTANLGTAPGRGWPSPEARGSSYQPSPRAEPRQATALPAPHPPEPPRTAGPAAAPRPGPPSHRPSPPAADPAAPQHAASPSYRHDWRPARPLGSPSQRVGPIPQDPSDVERRVTEEVLSKVNKFSVPLASMLRCNTVNIYHKLGSRMLGMVRQYDRGVLRDQLGTQHRAPAVPTIGNQAPASDSTGTLHATPIPPPKWGVC